MLSKLKFVLIVAALALAATAGWQIGTSEYANAELRDDLHDLASQLDSHIGFAAPKSDDDYRNAVIRKAEGHGIHLEPEQVTVERSGSAESPAIHLSADYAVNVKLLPGFSFALHFAPSDKRDGS